jgi:hypothetical protein
MDRGRDNKRGRASLCCEPPVSTPISPNRYQGTYLSREALDRAPLFMAIQKIKSEKGDISGEAWEQVLAEILGDGARALDRSNKPVEDVSTIVDGHLKRISAKTAAPTQTTSRPMAEDWLGTSDSWVMARLTPLGSLPRGKTPETASPRAIGARLIAAYNDNLRNWDVTSLLYRVRCDALDCWQYLYWEEEVRELDPKDFLWREVSRSDWSRCLVAWYKPGRGPRFGDRDAPAFRWLSGTRHFTERRQIPLDADIFEVRDTSLRSRGWATDVLSTALQAELLNS